LARANRVKASSISAAVQARGERLRPGFLAGAGRIPRFCFFLAGIFPV